MMMRFVLSTGPKLWSGHLMPAFSLHARFPVKPALRRIAAVSGDLHAINHNVVRTGSIKMPDSGSNPSLSAIQSADRRLAYPDIF
jgi:hypothetical protein